MREREEKPFFFIGMESQTCSQKYTRYESKRKLDIRGKTEAIRVMTEIEKKERERERKKNLMDERWSLDSWDINGVLFFQSTLKLKCDAR